MVTLTIRSAFEPEKRLEFTLPGRAMVRSGSVRSGRGKADLRYGPVFAFGMGIVLVTTWYEEGRFTFSPVQDGSVSLTAIQLVFWWLGRREAPIAGRRWRGKYLLCTRD